MRRRRAACIALFALASACASAPPVVTAPATPAHPEFMFPAAPPGTSSAILARIERGWHLLQRNDVPAAEGEFAAVLRVARGFAPGLTAQGYAALVRQQASEALTNFDAALASGASYAPALLGRGLALLELERDGEAIASFEAALAADPSRPDLARRIEALRLRQSQDRVASAERAVAERRWDDAREAYRAAIADSPSSPFLYRDLAAVERQAGNQDAALQQARRAVEMDPGDARSHVLVAQVLAERADFEGALAAYSRAASLDPSPALDRAMADVRDRVREATLPAEFQEISAKPEITRAEVAALLGVRLAALLVGAPQQQVITTDVRDHWAAQWIQACVRAGAIEVFPNYTFQPETIVRRGDLADVVSRVLALVEATGPIAALAPSSGAAVIADVPPDHLAFAAVRRAVDAGVMGLDNGAFRLLHPVSGEEAVEAVVRLVALAEHRP